jgi:chromosome segregation ATPase
MGNWGGGKDLYHKDRNYLVFALFFTCHYWYMFVKEEQYRAAQRRLKICRQKMDAIKRSIHNNNKPSSTIPESTFNESAEYIQAMKNDISTLSKKLEVSEEQIRSNTIKYERLKIHEKELRRCVLKAQDSDEDARRQLYACHDHMNQFEQKERDLRNEVEQTMRGLKDEQLRCKALSDQLSEQKVQHMMDTQKLEHIISRSEQEVP